MIENGKTVRPRGTDSAKVVEVIMTSALVGLGTKDDPCRIKTQYWSFNGMLLGEVDNYLRDMESASLADNYLRDMESASSNANSESI